jgi:hypothetical protein
MMEELRTLILKQLDLLRILVSSEETTATTTTTTTTRTLTYKEVIDLSHRVDELYARAAKEWKRNLPPPRKVDGNYTQESLHALFEILHTRRATLESYLQPTKS